MTPEKLKKKYAKSYKQGLTTTPDPESLEKVDYDDPKLKGKDGYNDYDKIDAIHHRNEVVIMGWEDQAKKTRAWIGRTLADHVGDGSAVYVVIKENKKSVRIRVCQGIGDDYFSTHWGYECTLNKGEACFWLGTGDIGEKEVLPYDMVRK